MSSVNAIDDIKASLKHCEVVLPRVRGANLTTLQAIITSLKKLIVAMGG